MAVEVLNKLFFLVTFVPLKFGWLVRLFKRASARTCPNCRLPLMVRRSSDAGFLAKRKQEIRDGKHFAKPETARIAFGRELAWPGQDLPTPRTLNEILEGTVRDNAPLPTPSMLPPRPRKPIDPDAW